MGVDIYVFAAFTLGIIISSYLIGMSYGGTTEFQNYLARYNKLPSVSSFFDAMINWIFSADDALVKVIIGVVVVGTLLTGGNLVAVVPFALGVMIANVMVFPFASMNGIPIVSDLLAIFVNFCIFVCFISFVRTG